MCGIAGFLGIPEGYQRASAVLNAMTGALSHRGPDGQGTYLDERVGLGHSRLSIIDLDSGKQPLSNEDDSVWISFNGEIFNYIELRQYLISRGHVFKTHSDTEVIVHLYEERGIDCLEALNGDFALALWDKKKNTLILARDRMGVRPLYYTVHKNTLYFASEIKALLTVPGVERQIDPIALDQTFTFWFSLAPRTIFKNISELPAAHVLVARDGALSVRPYWSLDYPDQEDADACHPLSEGEMAEELQSLLIESTRLRLRADVPVGAYLSGGLDSAIIASCARAVQPEAMQTFSITFDSGEFDESAYQMHMVTALGTRHEDIRCSTDDIARVFPEVIRHIERPIVRSAPAPMSLLAELTKTRHLKVVLTGEGADELFGGYDLFKEAKLRRFCARQPDSQWRPSLFRRLYPYISGLQGQSSAYLKAFFATGLDETHDPLFSHLPRFRTTSGVKLFYSPSLREQIGDYDALEDLRSRLPQRFVRWHPLSQAQYLETAFLLPNYLLSSQGDRVAMAHGVEGRYPFLDPRVIDFAVKIPPRLRLRGLREKHLLRESFRSMLPDVITNRVKQPYRAPDSLSFTGPQVPSYVREALSPAAVTRSGYFNARAVERLHHKCRTQADVSFRDNMSFIGILSSQLWHQEFISAATPRVHPYVLPMSGVMK